MSFEQTVIQCASPALCGLKPANLFSIRTEMLEEARDYLSNLKRTINCQGKDILIIQRGSSTKLLFVYDVKLLSEVLKNYEAIFYLKSKGYPVEDGFISLLEELVRRLTDEREFPHEIGIFLGYPMEDVIGFETFGGRNCLYHGSWAVYSNVERARKQMNLYSDCCMACSRMLEKGIKISEIEKNYRFMKKAKGNF
jgi:hypothetical protein